MHVIGISGGRIIKEAKVHSQRNKQKQHCEMEKLTFWALGTALLEKCNEIVFFL
jgi:hypothetical protein